ncbi:hypothetical protein MY1884_006862 [Beauveria asiatica]
MKLSIIIAASAGLAAATPLRVRQTESKRPFVQPAKENDFGKCGNTQDKSEECVGSRQDPSLKPFFPGPNWDDFEVCGNPLYGGNRQGHSEPCVGTVMFCSKGYWAEYKEESFASEEECLKARNPEFAAPKPAPEPTPEPESKPTSKPASESASEVTAKPQREPTPGFSSKPASEPKSKPTQSASQSAS